MITEKVQLHIGLDDTDSRLGGCTTYTGARIFQDLTKKGFEPLDFPWLVRLNPNIPWKTRGNGAVSLHFAVDRDKVSQVKRLVLSTVAEDSHISQPSTDPAIVFLEGSPEKNLRDFASKALNQVLTVDEARKLCLHHNVHVHVLKGYRGIVGALAAVGAGIEAENTFEIIAYRTRDHYGTKRTIDTDSVNRMDEEFRGLTFSNRDPETDRVLVFPHGPDPVLFGIRGEDPTSLVYAARVLRVGEPIALLSVFRTNAGTNAHLTRTSSIGQVDQYDSVILNGTVDSAPRIISGGHVFFSISDDSGSITCVAFAPTGPFRKIVSKLVQGDIVKAFGGVHHTRHGSALNLEKLEVIELADSFDWINPLCPHCGARCESAGRNQGFRCRKCPGHYPKAVKIPVKRERLLRPETYLPPPRAHRHLTRPAERKRRTFDKSLFGWKNLVLLNAGRRGWLSNFDRQDQQERYNSEDRKQYDS